jgi:hypothetical protein
MIDPSSPNQSSRSRQPKPRLGKPDQLLCYAIAAKRYVLFTIDRQGRINISDRDDEENYSRHGLGHLLNPIDPEAESRDWIRQFWEMIVGDALGRRVKRPKWFNRPAISRLTATSPDLVLRLQHNRKRGSYARSIKPMNFLIAAHVSPFQVPAEASLTQFQLIAPYTPDPQRWASMTWTDFYSGRRYAIVTSGNSGGGVIRVKSYADVFEEYRSHPEPKSLGPDGEPCGPRTTGKLGRRPVFAISPIYVGKESNRLEEVEQATIHDWDEVRSEYHDPKANPWCQIIVPVLQKMNRLDVANLSGVTARHVARLRNLKEMPSSDLRERLTRIAGDHARRRIGENSEMDDLQACASLLGQVEVATRR